MYAEYETNPLIDGAAYHSKVDRTEGYSLKMLAEVGGRITRLRLLTERRSHGWIYDISYCYGELSDGTVVAVTGYPSGGDLRKIKGDLIEWAKEEGVYAKGLGLLDEGNWSIFK